MARRTEIGASIAAALLALVTLLAALFLPLVSACGGSGRCGGGARLVSLTSQAVHVEPAVWLYIALMAALTLAGALGGLLDGARRSRRGLALLWLGAGLAFAGCALGALGVFGSLYLPSIVALVIAAVAGFARRQPLALPAARPRPGPR
ncbi:MAG TPA: hypothetical protein VID73_01650 [Ktedonobacterales bacterium]